jgi:hypothetical protein
MINHGTAHAIYIDVVSGGIGAGNGRFNFNGIKTEIHSTGRLLYCNAPARVSFINSTLFTRGGGNDQSDAMHIYLNGRLELVNCDLDYKILATTDNDSWSATNAPEIQATDCVLYRLPETLFSISHTGTNVGGKAKADFKGCSVPQTIGGDVNYTRQPIDQSINYNIGFTSQTKNEKVVCWQDRPNSLGLPPSAKTSVLPKNCLVTKILVVNSAAVAKQWRVTGPSAAVWITSALSTKMNVANVNEEIGATNTFTVENITDSVAGDGYVLIWYI